MFHEVMCTEEFNDFHIEDFLFLFTKKCERFFLFVIVFEQFFKKAH